MVTLLVDKSVMAKFLVDTLEAKEPVTANAMFCVGESNDAWQQTPEKLLKAYDVTAIDSDGWMICVPKPQSSVEFVEVNRALLEKHGAWEQFSWAGANTFIVGHWGEVIDGIEKLQRFQLGDTIARSREDNTDQWRVAAKIWRSTYIEIGRD